MTCLGGFRTFEIDGALRTKSFDGVQLTGAINGIPSFLLDDEKKYRLQSTGITS